MRKNTIIWPKREIFTTNGNEIRSNIRARFSTVRQFEKLIFQFPRVKSVFLMESFENGKKRIVRLFNISYYAFFFAFGREIFFTPSGPEANLRVINTASLEAASAKIKINWLYQFHLHFAFSIIFEAMAGRKWETNEFHQKGGNV